MKQAYITVNPETKEYSLLESKNDIDLNNRNLSVYEFNYIRDDFKSTFKKEIEDIKDYVNSNVNDTKILVSSTLIELAYQTNTTFNKLNLENPIFKKESTEAILAVKFNDEKFGLIPSDSYKDIIFEDGFKFYAVDFKNCIDKDNLINNINNKLEDMLQFGEYEYHRTNSGYSEVVDKILNDYSKENNLLFVELENESNNNYKLEDKINATLIVDTDNAKIELIENDKDLSLVQETTHMKIYDVNFFNQIHIDNLKEDLITLKYEVEDCIKTNVLYDDEIFDFAIDQVDDYLKGSEIEYKEISFDELKKKELIHNHINNHITENFNDLENAELEYKYKMNLQNKKNNNNNYNNLNKTTMAENTKKEDKYISGYLSRDAYSTIVNVKDAKSGLEEQRGLTFASIIDQNKNMISVKGWGEQSDKLEGLEKGVKITVKGYEKTESFVKDGEQKEQQVFIAKEVSVHQKLDFDKKNPLTVESVEKKDKHTELNVSTKDNQNIRVTVFGPGQDEVKDLKQGDKISASLDVRTIQNKDNSYNYATIIKQDDKFIEQVKAKEIKSEKSKDTSKSKDKDKAM